MLERFIKIFGVISNNVFVLGADFCNLAKKNLKTKKNHVNFVVFENFSPTFE
jgi:hypothetical protein